MTFEKRKQINTNWAKVNMSIGAFWLLLTNKCQDRDILMLSLLLCGHTPKHWKIQITRWNGSFSTFTHLAYWTNGFICIKTVHYLLHPSQDSCHVRKMSPSWAKIKWHDGNYIHQLGKMSCRNYHVLEVYVEGTCQWKFWWPFLSNGWIKWKPPDNS